MDGMSSKEIIARCSRRRETIANARRKLKLKKTASGFRLVGLRSFLHNINVSQYRFGLISKNKDVWALANSREVSREEIVRALRGVSKIAGSPITIEDLPVLAGGQLDLEDMRFRWSGGVISSVPLEVADERRYRMIADAIQLLCNEGMLRSRSSNRIDPEFARLLTRYQALIPTPSSLLSADITLDLVTDAFRPSRDELPELAVVVRKIQQQHTLLVAMVPTVSELVGQAAALGLSAVPSVASLKKELRLLTHSELGDFLDDEIVKRLSEVVDLGTKSATIERRPKPKRKFFLGVTTLVRSLLSASDRVPDVISKLDRWHAALAKLRDLGNWLVSFLH